MTSALCCGRGSVCIVAFCPARRLNGVDFALRSGAQMAIVCQRDELPSRFSSGWGDRPSTSFALCSERLELTATVRSRHSSGCGWPLRHVPAPLLPSPPPPALPSPPEARVSARRRAFRFRRASARPSHPTLSLPQAPQGGSARRAGMPRGSARLSAARSPGAPSRHEPRPSDPRTRARHRPRRSSPMRAFRRPRHAACHPAQAGPGLPAEQVDRLPPLSQLPCPLAALRRVLRLFDDPEAPASARALEPATNRPRVRAVSGE